MKISFFVIVVIVFLNCTYGKLNLRGETPIVIAHRGASGYRPEHSLSAYELAIDMNSDFVELDLVSTSDHRLICMHSLDLEEVTDVAEHKEFLSKKRTLLYKGVELEGWWVSDFTLAEIKTLRLKQRFPFRNRSRDNLYQISTLEEVLQLFRAKTEESKEDFGIYIEVKHAALFRSLGLPIEEILVNTLKSHNINDAIIETFDFNSIVLLHQLCDFPLVQLIGNSSEDPLPAWMMTDEGLKNLSNYASGIGVDKGILFRDAEKSKEMMTPTYIERAHKYNLAVHPWTIRSERPFVFSSLFDSVEQEVEYLLYLGVDGFFTDNPDVGVRIRDKFNQPIASRIFNVLSSSIL